MKRCILIRNCSSRKEGSKCFVYSVCTLDGCVYTSRMKNNKIYNLIQAARDEGDESLLCNCLLEMAKKVLYDNDIYFDHVELI